MAARIKRNRYQQLNTALTHQQLSFLDELAIKYEISRNELIRKAVDMLIADRVG